MTTEPKKTRQQLQDELVATTKARIDEIDNQIKLLEMEKKPLKKIIKKELVKKLKKLEKSQITAKKK